MKIKNKKVDNNSKKVEKITFLDKLNKDDINFICYFLEENVDLCENKKYCEKLIKEFGLNSFDELKFFINDLLTKNNINKKRVEKLRKVLMNNNEKEESSSSGYNNNEENENDYDNMVMNHNEGINGNNNISHNNFNFKYH